MLLMTKSIYALLPVALLIMSVKTGQSQVLPANQVPDSSNGIHEKSFFEIQKEFNDFWGPKQVKDGYYFDNGIKKKASGWKQFKRWEWYWESRIDPQTGAFPIINRADVYNELKESEGGRNVSGNWQSLGPDSSPGGYAGLGRLNCVGFRTGDNSTYYAGSPSGGLWKTTDDGGSWTAQTDNNTVLGVSDVVVIAGTTTTSDVVYIATGDRDGGSMWSLGGGQYNDNNTIGVLKSTNGGSTWSVTALTYLASANKSTNRILKHPTSDATLYAATTDGVYKTTNGGTTWPQIYSGNEFVSMEFKPGDPTYMYGGTMSGQIFRSTNSGVNWSAVLTVSGGSRVQLAVSPNNAAYVYAVVANSDNGLEGIYKSTNSGAGFTKVYDGSVAGQNMLGWNCDGTGTGGQGWYDLCLAADPNNAAILYLGGVNTWKSTNSGSGWSISNMWTGNSCGAPEVHADKHFLAFQNGTSTLFECNDGGLYKTTNGGTSWIHLSNDMVISQVYRMGVSQSSSSSVIAGLQDNGTKSKISGTWTDVLGGDGMECAINPTNASIQYGEYYYGNLYRTTDSWANATSITSGLTGSAWWVTPFILDATTYTTLYVGYSDVWRSLNQGNSWTQISSWGGNTIRSIAVAPSNSNYIYAAIQTILYKTTIGGTTWTDITSGLPVGSSYITYIAVKNNDPLTVWVTFGAYNSNRVYQTINGGTTWTNISAGLPNIPVMSVVQNAQNTSQIELYAGTDVGVYVKVGTADWTAYNGGLPNVVVTELEIYYNPAVPHLSRLRAATFGRGLWESELYAPSTALPVADFVADNTSPAVYHTVGLTDQTVNDPTSWAWTFNPSTIEYKNGTSSSSQNPQIRFKSSGTYNVSLYAANANGNSTETKTGYISVGEAPVNFCTGNSSNPYGYISHVVFGSINNTSTYTNVGGPDPNDLYYQDWTAQSTNITVGNSYSITITNGSSNSSLDLGIWIDWNRDGDFSDLDEDILTGLNNGGYGTFSINVPVHAEVGKTRMRIRTCYYDNFCIPCGTSANGEVEDYSVNVQPGSTTWNGTTTNWTDASNWPNGIVPGSSYIVTIPSAPVNGNFPVIQLNTAAKCYSFTLQNGATISVLGTLEVER
jgi:PKD repeat protein